MIKQLFIRCAYNVMLVWWFVRRPETFGVKCLVEHQDNFLLVRHSYGHGSWLVPGGGVKKQESPENAVVREVCEELGISIDSPKYIGEYKTSLEFKKDTVWCYHAQVDDADFCIDNVELVAAKWFPKKDLIQNKTLGMQNILKLYETH